MHVRTYTSYKTHKSCRALDRSAAALRSALLYCIQMHVQSAIPLVSYALIAALQHRYCIGNAGELLGRSSLTRQLRVRPRPLTSRPKLDMRARQSSLPLSYVYARPCNDRTAAARCTYVDPVDPWSIISACAGFIRQLYKHALGPVHRGHRGITLILSAACACCAESNTGAGGS